MVVSRMRRPVTLTSTGTSPLKWVTSDMHIQVDWDRSFISLHELGCFAAPYLSLRLEPWLVVHHVHLAPQRILLLLVLEDEEVAVMHRGENVEVVFSEELVVRDDLLSL